MQDATSGSAAAHQQMVTCIDAASNGVPLLISGSLDMTIAVWDLRRMGSPPVATPLMSVPVRARGVGSGG